MTIIDAEELRQRLRAGDEIALADVREEGAFSKAHIFLGSCVPLSHLEFRAGVLIPRRTTPVVLTDGGPDDGGLSHRAADRLAAMGYSDVAVLDGGIAGWNAAGHELFSGVNVPSKAFGEFVEHYYDTPRISATELDALQKAGTDLVILDSRPMDEFNRMSIPGGIDCPGAELVYRVGTVAPDAETLVVVNCAGRTRSIIGAQSLINAGIPNRVMALKDGTMGWELAGLTCARGENAHAGAPRGEILKAATGRVTDVAARFGVRRATSSELAVWQGESDRTTFLLDVRTAEEFAAGHWPGARHVPGGQLVQATDEYVGVHNARIVLADGADGVRATMTASWLVQLGHRDVRVLAVAPDAPEAGHPTPEPALFDPFADTLTAGELRTAQEAGGSIRVIDFADSLTFQRGHIPSAKWAIRARMTDCARMLSTEGPVVLTSPDGLLAHYAARELEAERGDLTIRVLAGGTAAWQAAGRVMETGIDGRTLTEIDDVWWKPYDNKERIRQAMEDYLTWEVGLVEQVTRDNLLAFRKFD
jgi:rhodanese-related sulfurtransferase